MHDVRISKSSWKREALKFQQLMLENPWLEDLDVELEYKDDEDGENILVHVKHAEFMDLTFHVADGFRIDTPESSERYGDTGQDAYEEAMPILIGMKAGWDLKEKSSGFDDFELSIDSDARPEGKVPAHEATIKFRHHSGGAGLLANADAFFKWDRKQQAFIPIDEENLPGGKGEPCKTIKDMLNYLESWSS